MGRFIIIFNKSTCIRAWYSLKVQWRNKNILELWTLMLFYWTGWEETTESLKSLYLSLVSSFLFYGQLAAQLSVKMRHRCRTWRVGHYWKQLGVNKFSQGGATVIVCSALLYHHRTVNMHMLWRKHISQTPPPPALMTQTQLNILIWYYYCSVVNTDIIIIIIVIILPLCLHSTANRKEQKQICGVVEYWLHHTYIKPTKVLIWDTFYFLKMTSCCSE